MNYMISLFHCVIWAVIITADLSVFLLDPADGAAVPPCREGIIRLRADHGSGSGVHVSHARTRPFSCPLSAPDPPPLVSPLWFPTATTGLNSVAPFSCESYLGIYPTGTHRLHPSPAAQLQLIENVGRGLTQGESPGEQSPLPPMSWPHRETEAGSALLGEEASSAASYNRGLNPNLRLRETF